MIKKGKCISVCTAEKALRLFDCLAQANRLSELALVVCDELHFVADHLRGAVYEEFLSRLVYVNQNQQSAMASPKIQIVAMSATLPNLVDLAQWLGATHFSHARRPVKLEQFMHFGHTIYDASLNEVRKFERSVADNPELEHVTILIQEVWAKKQAALIFCATKGSCKTCAESLCKKQLVEYTSLEDEEKRARLIHQLKLATHEEESRLLIPFLTKGVAIHHSEITPKARSIIEEGFKSRVLQVICCTPTLSTGVNLPAHLVIIRSKDWGGDVTASEYHQMAGRAGRTNLCDEGLVYLFINDQARQFVKTKDVDKIAAAKDIARRIWQEDVKPATSQFLPKDMQHELLKETEHVCFSAALLRSVAMVLLKSCHCKLVKTSAEGLKLISSMLFARSIASNMLALLVAQALEVLISSSSCPKSEIITRSHPRYLLLVSGRGVTASVATCEKTKSHAGSSERAFFISERIINGGLQCRTLGSACVESSFALEQAEYVENLVKRQVVVGWGATSRLPHIEFLCGDVSSNAISILKQASDPPAFVGAWLYKHNLLDLMSTLNIQMDGESFRVGGSINLEFWNCMRNIIIDKYMSGSPVIAVVQELQNSHPSSSLFQPIHLMVQESIVQASKMLRFLWLMDLENLASFLNAEIGIPLLSGCIAPAKPLMSIAGMTGALATHFFYSGCKSVESVADLSQTKLREIIDQTIPFVESSSPQFRPREVIVDDLTHVLSVNAKRVSSAHQILLRKKHTTLMVIGPGPDRTTKRSRPNLSELLITSKRENDDLSYLQNSQFATVARASGCLPSVPLVKFSSSSSTSSSSSSSSTLSSYWAPFVAATTSLPVPTIPQAPAQVVPSRTTVQHSLTFGKVAKVTQINSTTICVDPSHTKVLHSFLDAWRAVDEPFAFSLCARTIKADDLLARDSVCMNDLTIQRATLAMTLSDISGVSVCWGNNVTLLSFPAIELAPDDDQIRFKNVADTTWLVIAEMMTKPIPKIVFFAKGMWSLLRLINIHLEGPLWDPSIAYFTLQSDSHKINSNSLNVLDDIYSQCTTKGKYDMAEIHMTLPDKVGQEASQCARRAAYSFKLMHFLKDKLKAGNLEQCFTVEMVTES